MVPASILLVNPKVSSAIAMETGNLSLKPLVHLKNVT